METAWAGSAATESGALRWAFSKAHASLASCRRYRPDPIDFGRPLGCLPGVSVETLVARVALQPRAQRCKGSLVVKETLRQRANVVNVALWTS